MLTSPPAPAAAPQDRSGPLAPEERRRVLLVTDAWYPQINGVVRTLDRTRAELEALGHHVTVVSPNLFRSIPAPTYPEIRLALFPKRRLRKIIGALRPNAIHIATEGPLGLTARALCVEKGLIFTTSFHTKFPEYVHARFRIPVRWSYAFLRWFHRPAARLMVSTETMRRELTAWGFRNIHTWSRGVDSELFRPRDKALFDPYPRPVYLYVGRVAVEKNIEGFLSLDLPGSKVVVGDGPQLTELSAKYPDAHFLGAKKGEELAAHYAAADCFVFPSRTDTFGLVLLEAVASGIPVAAFPVTGPMDVIGPDGPGVLDENLQAAAVKAVEIEAETCRRFALKFSWQASAQQFLENLHPTR